MSNDDGQLEDRKDFSADVEKALPESTALAKSDLSSAVDLLMALEKKCRVGNDIASLKKVCEHAVKVCAEVGDWDKMVHTLNFVAKRRSQKNGAIGEAVKEGMAWIEKCPESNDKKKVSSVILILATFRFYSLAPSRFAFLFPFRQKENAHTHFSCSLDSEIGGVSPRNYRRSNFCGGGKSSADEATSRHAGGGG